MIEFVLLEANRPFVIAIAIMFGIAILEGVTSVLGVGISRLVESIIPDSLGDVDVDADMDLDADADMDADAGPDMGGGASALSKLLGWLCVGRVPILVLAVLFLTTFGLTGLAIQGFVSNLTGLLLPALIASVGALVVTVPIVKLCASILARLIPKDESDAVSTSTFVGRVATITLGSTRQGQPTQAKLHDEKGQPHYVMVEPDLEDDEFHTGDRVLVVSRAGGRFRVIRSTNPAMADEVG